MGVIGGGNAIVPVIPTDYQALLEVLLAILANYFHLSTAIKAGASN